MIDSLFEFNQSEQEKIDLKIIEILFTTLYKKGVITIKEYNDLIKNAHRTAELEIV